MVMKDLTSLFEADTVFSLIGEVLGLVPFETEAAHYNSVVTNMQ